MARLSPPPAPCRSPAKTLRLRVEANPVAVRAGLNRLFSLPPLSELGADDRRTAEIVLAEVMNNIAKHAYAEVGGIMTIKITHAGPVVRCEVADEGSPMRDGCPPEGFLAEVREGELPLEGGYGWFLIRTLVKDLCYRRTGSGNLLIFRLSVKQ